MLCDGFFKVKADFTSKVKSEIGSSDYLKWGYYIAFHSYTFRIFMHNEFNLIRFTAMKVGDGIVDASHKLRHGRRRRGRGLRGTDRLRCHLLQLVLRCGIVLFPHRAALRPCE